MKHATAVAFRLRDYPVEPVQGDVVTLGRGAPLENLLSVPDVSPLWLQRALRTLLDVFEVPNLTVEKGVQARLARRGYARRDTGVWLGIGALVDAFCRLPGGRSIVPKLRNAPQFDSALFEIELGMGLARSHASSVAVEPQGCSADFALTVSGLDLAVECKATVDIDLVEHQAFRRRNEALLGGLSAFGELPWRIDVEIGAPIAQRDLASSAQELRSRIAQHRDADLGPTSFQVGPAVQVTLRAHDAVPQSALRPRWYECWRADGGHIAYEPSFWDPVPAGIPVVFRDSDRANPERIVGPSVTVHGYVYVGPLKRKYSKLISEALNQAGGRPTVVAIQCTHPQIAHEVALRKVNEANKQLLGVWINPFRPGQHVTVRRQARWVIDLVRAAQPGESGEGTRAGRGREA